VRHWRPSAKVKAHGPERSLLCVTAERSFSCVTAERPTERFVDMEVSRKVRFEL